jgi:hypothetical protein
LCQRIATLISDISLEAWTTTAWTDYMKDAVLVSTSSA